MQKLSLAGTVVTLVGVLAASTGAFAASPALGFPRDTMLYTELADPGRLIPGWDEKTERKSPRTVPPMARMTAELFRFTLRVGLKRSEAVDIASGIDSLGLGIITFTLNGNADTGDIRIAGKWAAILKHKDTTPLLTALQRASDAGHPGIARNDDGADNPHFLLNLHVDKALREVVTQLPIEFPVNEDGSLKLYLAFSGTHWVSLAEERGILAPVHDRLRGIEDREETLLEAPGYRRAHGAATGAAPLAFGMVNLRATIRSVSRIKQIDQVLSAYDIDRLSSFTWRVMPQNSGRQLEASGALTFQRGDLPSWYAPLKGSKASTLATLAPEDALMTFAANVDDAESRLTKLITFLEHADGRLSDVIGASAEAESGIEVGASSMGGLLEAPLFKVFKQNCSGDMLFWSRLSGFEKFLADLSQGGPSSKLSSPAFTGAAVLRLKPDCEASALIDALAAAIEGTLTNTRNLEDTEIKVQDLVSGDLTMLVAVYQGLLVVGDPKDAETTLRRIDQSDLTKTTGSLYQRIAVGRMFQMALDAGIAKLSESGSASLLFNEVRTIMQGIDLSMAMDFGEREITGTIALHNLPIEEDYERLSKVFETGRKLETTWSNLSAIRAAVVFERRIGKDQNYPASLKRLLKGKALRPAHLRDPFAGRGKQPEISYQLVALPAKAAANRRVLVVYQREAWVMDTHHAVVFINGERALLTKTELDKAVELAKNGKPYDVSATQKASGPEDAPQKAE